MAPKSKTPNQSELDLSTPTPLTHHPAGVYLASLTPGSRRTMHKALNVIARLLTNGGCDAQTLDWAALRYQHTAAVRAVLMEQYAPATANRMLVALRRTLQEARKLKLITASDYEDVVNFPPVRGESPKRGRRLKSGEMGALFQVCREELSLIGVRDAALIAILAGSGVRRSEAVALEVRDFDSDTGALSIRFGKGKRFRTVYLPEGAILAVMAWLEVRRESPGALIFPVRRGGHIKFKKMTDQAVMVIITKRATQAVVAELSPHDFRRTFICDLLEAGVDIFTVSRLVGHADPATTREYDLRGEQAKRDAVRLLQIPYE